MILAKKDMEKVGEIDPKELEKQYKQKTVLNIVRQFDQNGRVIIGKNYIKTKHLTKPITNCPQVFQEAVNGHPLWRGEWIRDQK